MWFGVMKEGERKAFGGIASPGKHAENRGGYHLLGGNQCNRLTIPDQRKYGGYAFYAEETT